MFRNPIAIRTAWATALSFSLTTAAVWAAAPADEVFTDPADAGPDYVVQGEYLGALLVDGASRTWGAQIIALGDGQFEAVGYEGGLPGQGWRRGDPQERAQGRRDGERVVFTGDQWSAEWAKETVTVRDTSGGELGTLKKVVRVSPTLGAPPPAGAVVLFDGTSADAFEGGKLLPGGLLAPGCVSKQTFRAHAGHLEFRTPFKPKARGQARGNSGMYVDSRYEVQILDSFGLEGADNECGGIYKIKAPDVNMCYPPLTWQTYDWEFTPAQYDAEGAKVRNARLTVRHNGVLIHNNLELPKGTPGRLPEGPEPAGLFLQDHHNPVVFRNIWILER